MPPSVRLPTAVLCALLVMIFGAVYLHERTAHWTSKGAIVLVPADGREQSSIIQSFGQSGTAGTMVEFLSGPTVRGLAGSPEGELTVRLVPDTRVIDVELTGTRRDRVRAGADAIMAAAVAHQSELGDPWRLRVLAAAGTPLQAGPGTPLVLAATGIIALLAALAVFVIPTRATAAPAEGQVDDLDDHRHAA